MKKVWVLTYPNVKTITPEYKQYESYAEAEVAAKRALNENRSEVVIFEAVAVARRPVPEAEITKL